MAGNVLVDSAHSLTAGRTRGLDMAVGGQQGAMPDPKRWVSSASYSRQKLIPVLIEAPGHMQYMDNGVHRINMLKSLVELMATSITGLTSKLDVSYNTHLVGNAGELHHTPAGVKRAVSEVVYTLPEKEGKSVYHFMNDWITQLLQDPDTSYPGLITKQAWVDAGKPEFLPDAISMTVLFIEPSKDLSRVTSAWLVTNMMPTSSGEDEGKMVKNEDNEAVEHQITFTGTTRIGKYPDKLAQEYLDNLTKEGFQPAALAAAYDKRSSFVDTESEDYKNKVQEVSDSADELGPPA